MDNNTLIRCASSGYSGGRFNMAGALGVGDATYATDGAFAIRLPFTSPPSIDVPPVADLPWNFDGQWTDLPAVTVDDTICCPWCEGKGHQVSIDCEICDGVGYEDGEGDQKCWSCQGDGERVEEIERVRCRYCKGLGVRCEHYDAVVVCGRYFAFAYVLMLNRGGFDRCCLIPKLGHGKVGDALLATRPDGAMAIVMMVCATDVHRLV